MLRWVIRHRTAMALLVLVIVLAGSEVLIWKFTVTIRRSLASKTELGDSQADSRQYDRVIDDFD